MYFTIGTKVKGVYYGCEYTGEVYHVRPHTLNDSIKHYIKLDNPIFPLGSEEPRDEIIVNTFDDNTENTIEEIV